MPATSPLTEGNDYLNAYIRLDGTYGPLGAEVDLVIKNKSFDAGGGTDIFYIDANTAKAGSWFTLSATNLNEVALTNSSGGTVKVAGLEKLEFQNITLTLGTSAANSIKGTTSNDIFLFGAGGVDSISGNSGNDAIFGGTGGDSLSGDAGSDKITGGTGRDLMAGGTGIDTFDFNSVTETGKTSASRDIIKDFAHLTDKIDLDTIDVRPTVAGDQDFKFMGTAAFTGTAASLKPGQLRYKQYNYADNRLDKTLIFGDVDGNGTTDFQIELSGLKTLSLSDFWGVT